MNLKGVHMIAKGLGLLCETKGNPYGYKGMSLYEFCKGCIWFYKR